MLLYSLLRRYLQPIVASKFIFGLELIFLFLFTFFVEERVPATLLS